MSKNRKHKVNSRALRPSSPSSDTQPARKQLGHVCTVVTLIDRGEQREAEREQEAAEM
jgi:hypothetical protein